MAIYFGFLSQNDIFWPLKRIYVVVKTGESGHLLRPVTFDLLSNAHSSIDYHAPSGSFQKATHTLNLTWP